MHQKSFVANIYFFIQHHLNAERSTASNVYICRGLMETSSNARLMLWQLRHWPQGPITISEERVDV